MKKRSEYKPPVIASFLLKLFLPPWDKDFLLGDYQNIFCEMANNSGVLKAKIWYWAQVLTSAPAYIKHTIYWNITMIINYLKIALRNLKKYKTVSILNISGLAIGLACFITLTLYVQYEFSYDTQYPDSERIYRVAKSRKSKAKTDLLAANTTYAAPTLKERFPEVELASRLGNAHYRYLKVGDKKYLKDKLVSADPELFDLFDIRFIAGSKNDALNTYEQVVVTKHIADKYFGKTNPMGRVIMVDTVAYEVSAVIEDCPGNTHFKYDLIKRLKVDVDSPWHSLWEGWHCMNYIKLKDGVNADEFEAKIKYLPHEYIGEKLEKEGIESTLFLQPIESIHLYSNLIWENEAPGSPVYLYIFTAAGLFILLIAVMNYLNLSTARLANRAGEVGLRKVIGAQKRQLINQFISESVLLALIATILGTAIVLIILPSFNSLAAADLNVFGLLTSDILLILIGALILIGIVAGSYPAFILSGFKPAAVLSGELRRGAKASGMRKILVVVQFSMSIILITGSIMFNQQINFMKDQELGFTKDQKFVIEFNRSIIDTANYVSVREEFSKHPAVKTAAFSSSVPGRWMYKWKMREAGNESNAQMVNSFQVDDRFFRDYELEMVAGESFEEGRVNNGWIINEAAMTAFGWESPEEALKHAINRSSAKVNGVVKNFHYRGLQSTVEPVAIFHMVEDFRYLTLTVDSRNIESIKEFIGTKHNELFPGILYEHFFLDEDFDRQYNSEERISKIIATFTFIGIIIACLGLFGLAAFIAQQRVKEIGIRKVLGASIFSITLMLSLEFIKWVALANIIAWPAAWLIMDYWLQDFAYRIEISPFIFILAGLTALIIAVITVSFQAVKASLANPVDSLRHE